MHSSFSRYPTGLAAILLVAVLAITAACSDSESDPTEVPLTPEQQVVVDLELAGSAFPGALDKPSFVLNDAATGESYDFLEETAGFVTLLYFGYTNCPDICPVHLANISAALDETSSETRRGVKVVFVGVDAPRDTPERVTEWLGFFDNDFVGLTGTEEQLIAAQEAALVPVSFIDAEFEGGYTVAHAGWIFLYTQDDLTHLRYPSGIRQSAWAHDLELLVQDGWPAS